MDKPVRERFAEFQQSLNEVHGLVDSNTPSDLNKAATILKSLLPIYKELTNNEESKRPENIEILKEIKLRLTEETQRVMSKKEEAKNLQIQQQQQQEQQLLQQQQQQILESTSRNRAFTSPELPKPALLSGYLKKQGDKGLVKTFKKRWFQQRESKLFYYDKEGDTEAYGFVNLPDMIGVKTVDSGFELATPTRVYIFQVLKPSDLNYWTEGLKDYKKYYQSLQNSQKFGGENSNSPNLSSSTSYSDFRKFSDSNSTSNTPIKDRRGTVSGAMLGSTYNIDSQQHHQQQFMSSSYNPGDEELKRRELEILKRHQQQPQPQQPQDIQPSQSSLHSSPQQQGLSRSQSQNQLAIDSNSNTNSNINSNNNSVNNTSPVLSSNQQSPQQSPYNSRHNSYNYSNSPIIMDYNQQQPVQQQQQQQFSQSYQQPNNYNNNISPKFESQQSYNNENQSSYGKLNLESIKQSIEDELKKKYEQEKKEILDNENKKRQEIENEIKRTKELLEKSQLESHQKIVALNIEIKNKNNENEELKAQVNVFTEKNETLQSKVRELESIKPIETFPHEFLWTEEVTSRDQKILQQQQRIRELEESIKLKDNAVNVIKRENELLRHETEKKDKYINELLESNKSGVGNKSLGSTGGSNSNSGNSQNDILKIKESLAAHQTQNSFLLQEINRLETQSQFKLDLKLQQIDELQKQMEEQLYQFHRFRESIIGTVSNEYCDKIEKENLDLKKEYFQVLGVSIKLHRLREGDPVNVDIASLFDKVIKENVHYRNYPEFLNQELKSY